MSETSQGHGWWVASDGKWYPPEAWTGPSPQMGQTPSPYPTTPTPSYYGSGMPLIASYAPPRPTNGLAIASLVCSCAGIVPFFFGITCVLGIIFGFVARSRIKKANGALRGEGLALAGIIVGFSLIGLFILVLVLLAALGHAGSCGTSDSFRMHCSPN